MYKKLAVKYPGINNVAGFLDSASQVYENRGNYPPFNELGIDNIEAFLDLIGEENEKAIELYTKIKDILKF